MDDDGFFGMFGGLINQNIFDQYDENCNGTLEMKEIRVLLVEEYGLEPDQINVQALLLDKDGSNDISFDEFNTWIDGNNILENVKDDTKFAKLNMAAKLFNEIDENKNGTLDHEEFKKFYRQSDLPEDQIKTAIRELDYENTKSILFEPFMKWLTKKPIAWFGFKKEQPKAAEQEQPEDDFFDFLIDGDAINQAIFDKYDKDGNEKLDMKEIRVLLEEEYGLNPDQIDVQALLLDKDGSNDICFDEFNDWMNGNNILDNVQDDTRFAILKKFSSLFKKADANGNGSLDYNEFKAFYAENCFPSADTAIKEMNPSNNNSITFEEFQNWLKWKPLEWFASK